MHLFLLLLQQGEITRIIPHRATGRADYFGPPVNRAARFLAASAPGQILAERCLVEECVQFWSADELVSIGPGPPQLICSCCLGRQAVSSQGSLV